MEAAEKATGKSAAEIYKMMEGGKLLAKDFLVPFAKAMREIVRENKALEKATQKLTSQQHRMNTAYKTLVNDIFQKGGGVELFSSMFQDIATTINQLRPIITATFRVFSAGIGTLWNSLSGIVGLVVDLTAAIYKLAQSSGALKPLKLLFLGLEIAIYGVLEGLEELRMMLRGERDFEFLNAFKSLNKYVASPVAMAADAGTGLASMVNGGSGGKTVTTGDIYISSPAASTVEASRDIMDQLFLQMSM